MKKVCIVIVSFLCLAACSKEKKLVQVKEHINLIITPDLSNRIESLYPKPVSDISLISSIYSSYYPKIYKIKNRVIGQKDRIHFKFTNPSIINEFKINMDTLMVDLSNMNLSNRIGFLTKGNFETQKQTIDTEVNKLYENALKNTTGGDVYNYFKTQINSNTIKKYTKSSSKKITNIQRNIIVLFTDGYLEAGLYGNKNCSDKKCLFLSKSKVDQFRRDFIKSGNSNLSDFFYESGYGIIPVQNENLKDTEILVTEMYDRSLRKETGSQTVSPNDLEILKLFWSDWLKKSGVKHYKLLGVSNSKEEFIAELLSFIEEK